MDSDENARTTPWGRTLIVERLAASWTVAGVAAALGTSPRTVRKWRDRFAAEGEAGPRDRSSRPHLRVLCGRPPWMQGRSCVLALRSGAVMCTALRALPSAAAC
jgi:hypothetical protein